MPIEKIEKANRPFLTFLKVAFAICFALAGIGIGCLYAQLQDLPDIKLLQTTSPSQATRIYDINGEVISQLWLEQRTLVSLDKIPLTLQDALIAIEDDRFYRHRDQRADKAERAQQRAAHEEAHALERILRSREARDPLEQRALLVRRAPRP